MATGAYSGTFMQTALGPNDKEVPTPSVRHGLAVSSPDPTTAIDSTTEPGKGRELDGTEFPNVVAIGGGFTTVDMPSAEYSPPEVVHDSEAALWHSPTQESSTTNVIAAHGIRHTIDNYEPPNFQGSREVYDWVYYNMTADQRGPWSEANQRGINSYPQNNPEGFSSLGHERFSFFNPDRGIPAAQTRRSYQDQILYTRSGYTPAQVHQPSGEQNPDGPWGDLFVPSRWFNPLPEPEMSREPESIDASILAQSQRNVIQADVGATW